MLFLKLLPFFLSLSITLPAVATLVPDASVDIALDRAMTAMHAAMDRIHPTGNPDADFAAMMIPHHQGAIDMAKVELQYGTDPRLRRLAQEIIVTQHSEIELMQLTLKHPESTKSH